MRKIWDFLWHQNLQFDFGVKKWLVNGRGVLHRTFSKFHRLCRMMKKTSVQNPDFFRPSVFELCNFLWFQFPIDFVHGWILAPCQFHKFDQICEKTQYTKIFSLYFTIKGVWPDHFLTPKSNWRFWYHKKAHIFLITHVEF